MCTAEWAREEISPPRGAESGRLPVEVRAVPSLHPPPSTTLASSLGESESRGKRAEMEGGSWKRSGGGEKKDLFHVIHKVPPGNSPYVRAKHLQVMLGSYTCAAPIVLSPHLLQFGSRDASSRPR
ncbi:hypothetical protein BHM03_00049531 [Ensete ventricosum]|nr:hypothetical protein BHM03_00049531 [Ensete ventricosum]